ncbi:polar amino acid transport system substrate-binding protein [Roseibium hamelinense]|uniref:Polar amino acid transport system substrate-binding protein n=1 Tax=Roseibium hamelinense TaxID=150831 RepID=A0A562TII6_9HYPH|nr:transporter substrate-binding domain-containing protein [Roseibium hamelinense]MTI45733.1 amino acid ABC transporter substrate-binding protein [Roseibium hamelinense]TWI93084.1 polar amino acid transport system substrate-binding protein [Roseibium hamelinense]
MRNHTVCNFFVASAAMLVVMTAHATALDCPRGGTLIAGASDYRPYQIVEGNMTTGMDFEVAETVLSKMGCSLKVDVLPWARHLKGLEDGDVDIASPVSKTAEREAFATFSSPYLNSTEVLFVPAADKDAYADLKAFFASGKKLGVIREYAYGGDYAALSEEFPDQIEVTDSAESNFKKLASGRIGATLGDLYVMSAENKAAGTDDAVVASDVVVSEYPLYYMFSKKSVPAEFVDAFSAQLTEIQENGEFEAITAKYR